MGSVSITSFHVSSLKANGILLSNFSPCFWLFRRLCSTECRHKNVKRFLSNMLSKALCFFYVTFMYVVHLADKLDEINSNVTIKPCIR